MSVFEKIREKLEEYHEYCINAYGVVGGNSQALATKQCIEMVNQVEQEHNNGWIPCSERLPSMEECHKDDNRFIVSDGNRSYQRFFDYKEKRFCEPFYRGTLNTFFDDCVTHWQPLPQPYKGRD